MLVIGIILFIGAVGVNAFWEAHLRKTRTRHRQKLLRDRYF